MSGDPGASRRRPSVRAVGPAPELSGLGLDALRSYRTALSAEEDMVSYWRRLLQGRLDLLDAQAALGHTLSLADLVRVLGDTGSGRSRRSLMRVPAPVDLPDLPDLDELCRMWEAEPQDGDERAHLVDGLRAKERGLSTYRTALHERIDAATAEMIMRYRQDPRAALDLLPHE